MKKTAKFLVAAFAWASIGCGIKGDPLPPAEQQTIQAAQEINPITEVPPTTETEKKIKKKNAY